MKTLIRVLPALTLSGLVGCASTMMEQRVVQQFADALQESNEPALRRVASERFEDTALRSENALKDLEILSLPKGKVTVSSVEDPEDETKRRVTVAEEGGGKYQFLLVNQPEKGGWVVDDVLVRQRREGTRMTRSTTEVLDLVQTTREFLEVWPDDPAGVSSRFLSADLAASVSTLPDSWLEMLARDITDGHESDGGRVPEAQLSAADAVVRVPSRNGSILIRMTMEDERWVVDDIEARDRREEYHPGSVRRQAEAMRTMVQFLKAWRDRDRDSLQQVVSSTLYSQTLQYADLSLLPLPGGESAPGELDIRAYSGNVTVMLPSDSDIVRFDLREKGTEDEVQDGFEVAEVTLYNRTTDEQRTLSSVFSAPVRARLFLSSLRDSDLPLLRQLSSAAFNERVWNRLENGFPASALPPLAGGPWEVHRSTVKGGRTELEMTSASGHPMTVVVQDENGFQKVDDVLFPDTTGGTATLRTRLSLSLPVISLAEALRNQNPDDVRRSVSIGFNRTVLDRTDELPPLLIRLAGRLTGPVMETHVTTERATVRLGSGPTPTEVRLVLERDVWVVDDIQTAGLSGHTVSAREQMETEIQQRMLARSTTPDGGRYVRHDAVTPIRRVSGEGGVTGVTNAAYTQPSTAPYGGSPSDNRTSRRTPVAPGPMAPETAQASATTTAATAAGNHNLIPADFGFSPRSSDSTESLPAHATRPAPPATSLRSIPVPPAVMPGLPPGGIDMTPPTFDRSDMRQQQTASRQAALTPPNTAQNSGSAALSRSPAQRSSAGSNGVMYFGPAAGRLASQTTELPPTNTGFAEFPSQQPGISP